MTYKDFEDFLGMRFAEENPTVLDDDYPDRMDQWTTELDVETWVKYADEYALIKYQDGYKAGLEDGK